MIKVLITLLLTSLITLGCSDEEQLSPPKEDHGDIFINNNLTFAVSQKTHPTGWGKANCLVCHNVNNIHKVDRISALSINLPRIERTIDAQGLKSCTNCHGSNGTVP